MGDIGKGVAYHGRLSCAATGRFAALLLPFCSVARELNVMASCTSAPSTSMSSTSDMLDDVYAAGC